MAYTSLCSQAGHTTRRHGVVSLYDKFYLNYFKFYCRNPNAYNFAGEIFRAKILERSVTPSDMNLNFSTLFLYAHKPTSNQSFFLSSCIKPFPPLTKLAHYCKILSIK